MIDKNETLEKIKALIDSREKRKCTTRQATIELMAYKTVYELVRKMPEKE